MNLRGMKMLECNFRDCGNKIEFVQEVITSFSCNAKKEREEKKEESTRYFCAICGAEVWDDAEDMT